MDRGGRRIRIVVYEISAGRPFPLIDTDYKRPSNAFEKFFMEAEEKNLFSSNFVSSLFIRDFAYKMYQAFYQDPGAKEFIQAKPAKV